MSSAGSRNQAGSTWQRKLAVYVGSGAVAALAAGALSGVLGSAMSGQTRAAVATFLALLAIGIGAIELTGRRVRPLQCDRETPQRWMRHGPLRWAALNGAALGVGLRTRLGFTLWYVVPAAALLGGSPWVGAAIWGLYGTTRTASAIAFVRALDHHEDFATLSDAIRAHGERARRICAVTLTLVGLLVVAAVGI